MVTPCAHAQQGLAQINFGKRNESVKIVYKLSSLCFELFGKAYAWALQKLCFAVSIIIISTAPCAFLLMVMVVNKHLHRAHAQDADALEYMQHLCILWFVQTIDSDSGVSREFVLVGPSWDFKINIKEQKVSFSGINTSEICSQFTIGQSFFFAKRPKYSKFMFNPKFLALWVFSRAPALLGPALDMPLDRGGPGDKATFWRVTSLY